ncbi:MAG: (2Fe-2S) ferredoxin domain-containing protein [candidate division KSB1 bacterium]|nr:(2Fe-2S) ferredoxin domain-containing protein [candidate division KSB1 bacterium]
MKTLADLRAVKEQAKKEMAAREKTAKYRVCVGMGTCGIAAGARDVMSALLDEISKRGVEDAVVTQTGCQGYCDQEPLVQVTQPDKTVISYGKVTPQSARDIVAQHIIEGNVLSDLVFKQD